MPQKTEEAQQGNRKIARKHQRSGSHETNMATPVSPCFM